MRKQMIGTGLMLALALGLALLAAAPASAVPVSATLTSIVGDVQVHAPGGTWKKATEGMTVKTGAEIKTGAKSTVVIKWSTKNVIKLTPYTNFTIKDMDVDPRSKTVNTKVELTTGKVKGRAEKLSNPNSSYTINTPTAVAGVRGTTFDMANTPDNATELYTYDGLMEASAQGQTVQVPAGTFVTIDPGQPPSSPQPIKDDEKFTCQSNEDCWSGVCVNGQCLNEENSIGNACYPEDAECSIDQQCCSGECSDAGKCSAVDAATLAAACVSQGGSCAADGECCKAGGLVCSNGQCTPRSQVCTAAGASCQNDNQCCSRSCEDGVCLDDAVGAARATNANCPAIREQQGCASAGCFWSASDNKCCSEEGCGASGAAGMFVTISQPSAGAQFPVSKGAIALTGTTLPNAECNVNGTPFNASPSGAFSGTIGDLSDGPLPITINCFDPASQKAANASVEIDIIGPPMLIITSPEEGFVACPTVNIAGLTDPGADVYLNGVSLFNSDKARVTSDGSFTFDGFRVANCNQPLLFEAQDRYSQKTQIVLTPGTGGNLAAAGVNISQVKLMVQPSGQWMYGQTMINAAVTVQASTPIPAGLLVDIVNPNTGEFLQSAMLYPQYGVTATDGNYYANAQTMIMAGPGPLFVQAMMGGLASNIKTLDLQPPACITGAARAVGGGAMTPGDGLDNDCDGLVDEELPDGRDNDGDGLIDEDLACDFNDPAADCDRDGVANGQDCNPFDPGMKILKTDAACAMNFAAAAVIPNDRIDNDGDGLIDEEAPDGLDNDGDRRIDEDTFMGCRVEDPYMDCDYDGILNRDDCNPFDMAVNFTKSDPACVTGCDPFSQPQGDCDKDGLDNSMEINLGTNPFNRDTDGDGYSDSAELAAGTDPRNPASNPGAGFFDSDGDGFPDIVELSYGSDPNNSASTPITIGAIRNVDSDGDGFPDDIERVYGSDPFNRLSTPMNPAAGASGVCTGGQEYDAVTRTCYCPRGTTWDPALFMCKIPAFAQCAAGQYFDEFMGGCVAACTGGQTADAINKTCYCASGLRDWSALQCASSCPVLADGTQKVADPYGDCVCPPDKPLWSTYRNTCVSACLPGFVVNEFNECVCPIGMFLDYSSGTCRQTTSATVCPAGTPGEFCDYGKFGDCDRDGIDNLSDASPCFNDTGSALCPADSDAPNCDLSAAGDCDYDGADNFWDPCPCRFGSPNQSYCPAISSCPSGTYLDPRVMGCVQTCSSGMVPNAATGECVCTTGFFDPYSGMCSSSCPPGMQQLTDSYGYMYCGCGGTTPLWNDFTMSCGNTCTGGMVPSPDYTMCQCPAGYFPDYATMQCMPMDYSWCGTTAPFQQGCPCTAAADCQSNICDMYMGQCMPAGGCDNNSYCDPGFENSATCSDCYCGDGLCDMAESSSASCQADCAGMCDASVMQGDCDGDGIINMNDMCPYLWVNAALRPDGCPDMSACPNYGSDMAGCSADPGCFWNYDYNECWTQGAGGCEMNVTEPTCMTAPGCVWDSMNMMCVPDFIGGCQSYVTQPTCAADPACAWDAGNMMCYYAGMGGCEMYTTDATCNADPNCSWSSMNNMCVTGSVSDCYSYVDQIACSNDPACMWDSMSMSCVYSGGICSSYVTEPTCMSDPSCVWNPGMMMCEPAGMGNCSGYADQMTCAGDPMCYWNFSDNMCYFTTTPCSMYMNQSSCDGAPNCSWNTGMMMCEETVSTCAQIMDQMTCENSNCVWDPGMMTCSDYAGGCNFNSICETGESMMTCTVDCPSCSAMLDSVDCIGDPACTWNGSLMQCEENASMCNFNSICEMGENTQTCMNDCMSCADIMDTTDCTNDPACMWNGTLMQCEAAGGSCNMNTFCEMGENTQTCATDCPTCGDIMDTTDCTNDPACMWNGTLMQCEPSGGSCNMNSACEMGENTQNCSDDCPTCADILDTTDCGNDATCEWSSGLMSCVNMGCAMTPYANSCACVFSGECASGYCFSSTTCQACSTSTDCGGVGNACNAGVCSTCSGPPYDNGCGGASPSDCLSNYLVGGTECAACSMAGDCALTGAGLECNAGVCETGACVADPTYQDGCSCISGTDCDSGTCTGGECVP